MSCLSFCGERGDGGGLRSPHDYHLPLFLSFLSRFVVLFPWRPVIRSTTPPSAIPPPKTRPLQHHSPLLSPQPFLHIYQQMWLCVYTCRRGKTDWRNSLKRFGQLLQFTSSFVCLMSFGVGLEGGYLYSLFTIKRPSATDDEVVPTLLD